MDWSQLGMTFAQNGATFIGNSANRAIGNWQNRKSWEKGLGIQMQYEKAMGKYQNELALDLWNKTNAKAQMQHLIDAGLNPGLMYGQSGPGGTTSGAGKGSNPGGPAPSNGGQGFDILGAKLAMAQAENIEADTRLKNVEATKREGPDTAAVNAGIEKMKQETRNEELKQGILVYETRMKEIAANIANLTQEEAIKQMQENTKILISKARQEEKSADFSEETYRNMVIQSNNTTLTQYIEMELKRSQISLTETQVRETHAKIIKISEEITRMQAQTSQGWEQLQQGEVWLQYEDQHVINENIRREFDTGTSAEIARIVNTISGAGKAGSGMYKDYKQGNSAGKKPQ